MAVTDEIKARLDILDLVSGYAVLQRSGRSYKGVCPFHSEKTPSFYVFPERQTWRCFGACATGGDLFAFYMQAENLDFAEALRRLASQAGVELPSKRDQGQRSLLHDINEEAAAYFRRHLGSSHGAEARAYLERRGVSPTAASTFELGLSPDDGHSLGDYLVARSFQPEQIATAGLTNRGDNGAYRDLFRGRLMFPIRSKDGSLGGLGARALDDSTPKYLNSPKTPVFDKGNTLYGLNLASESITGSGRVVVVEGYMDAITAHQHGFANVVASMGTALTGEQASTLRAMASQIVLALDPDTAGQEATLRSMESAWGVFHRTQMRGGPQGTTLYQRPQLPDLRVAPLPTGQDPDEVIRHDPAGWTALVDGAVPMMEYLFSALARRLDPSTPEGKAQLSQLLFPLVAAIEDPFLQDHYFQSLARLLGVATESLRASLSRSNFRSRQQRTRRPVRRQEEASASPFARLDKDPLEDHCLALLLQEPDLGELATSLRLEHFGRPENREVLAYWMEGYDPELLDEDLKPQWERLASMTLPPTDRGQRETALQDCVGRLEARHLRRLKLEEEIRLAETGPEELESQEGQVLDLNERIRHLLAEKVR